MKFSVQTKVASPMKTKGSFSLLGNGAGSEILYIQLLTIVKPNTESCLQKRGKRRVKCQNVVEKFFAFLSRTVIILKNVCKAEP